MTILEKIDNYLNEESKDLDFGLQDLSKCLKKLDDLPTLKDKVQDTKLKDVRSKLGAIHGILEIMRYKINNLKGEI